jgi:uncharacterized membrane protein YcaP (DUF421 family)
MNILSQIDWKSVFVPSVHIAEIFLRGTMVYLFLLLVLRVLRGRQAGAIGLSDLLVIVLIADAAQNAMASEYKSITEGIILITTIAFWDYFLDWLGYRSPHIQRLIGPGPLLLIKDGQMQRRNMRQEMITEDELMGQLRKQGVESVEEVRRCYLEGDGQISVITRNSNEKKGKRQGEKKLITWTTPLPRTPPCRTRLPSPHLQNREPID